MATRLLTIDPGVEGTGWALWGVKKKKLLQHGVLNRKVTDWQCAVEIMQTDFNQLIDDFARGYTLRVVCEGAEFFDTDKGHVAARSESLVKLAHLIGMYHGTVQCCLYLPFQLTPARVWKGQLSKKLVHQRIDVVLHRKFREHEADAIGLGLYVLGLAFQS